LRWPNSCAVSSVKVPAGFQLDKGEEQSDKRGFGHKKSPAEAGPEGKGKG